LIFNNHLLKTKLLAHLNDPIQTVIAEYSNFLGSSFLRDLYETDTLVAVGVQPQRQLGSSADLDASNFA